MKKILFILLLINITFAQWNAWNYWGVGRPTYVYQNFLLSTAGLDTLTWDTLGVDIFDRSPSLSNPYAVFQFFNAESYLVDYDTSSFIIYNGMSCNPVDIFIWDNLNITLPNYIYQQNFIANTGLDTILWADLGSDINGNNPAGGFTYRPICLVNFFDSLSYVFSYDSLKIIIYAASHNVRWDCQIWDCDNRVNWRQGDQCEITAPIFELVGDNYDGVIWEQSGTLASRIGIEWGNVPLIVSPNHADFSSNNIANLIKSQSTENDGGLLIENGSIELILRFSSFATGTECPFSIADTAVATTYWFLSWVADTSAVFGTRSNGTWQYLYYLSMPSNPLSINIWYHIVFELDSTGVNPLRCFVNNEQQKLRAVTTTDTTSFITNTYLNTNKIRVKYGVGGLIDSTPSNAFVGDVAEIRIYNKYLTNADIQLIYLTKNVTYNFGE